MWNIPQCGFSCIFFWLYSDFVLLPTKETLKVIYPFSVYMSFTVCLDLFLCTLLFWMPLYVISRKISGPFQEKEGTGAFLFLISLPSFERDLSLTMQARCDEISILWDFPQTALLQAKECTRFRLYAFSLHHIRRYHVNMYYWLC